MGVVATFWRALLLVVLEENSEIRPAVADVSRLLYNILSGTFSPGSAAFTFRARSCERTPPRPMLPVSVVLHCCVNVRARMTVLRPLIPPRRLVRVICCGNYPLSPLAGSRVFLHCHYPDASAPQLALRWLIEPVWPGAAIGSLSFMRAKAGITIVARLRHKQWDDSGRARRLAPQVIWRLIRFT